MQTTKSRASWVIALILLAALEAGASALAGQTAGEASPFPLLVGYSHWPDVNLNVVAINQRDGTQKIDPKMFQLFDGGTERPLQLTGSPDSPVSLAFLIDSSASVSKRQQQILSAVKTITHALPADSEVTFESFSFAAFIEAPFTPVSKIDFSPLDQLKASGSSALLDAVVATESYLLTEAKYPRRALVIISDGEENASQASLTQAAQGMERPGAPTVYVCTVHETRKSLRALGESRHAHRVLNFLATEGGGMLFSLDPDHGTAASQIVAAIHSQYALQFTASNFERDGKARKYEVRLPAKDVQVYELPRYWAPLE